MICFCFVFILTFYIDLLFLWNFPAKQKLKLSPRLIATNEFNRGAVYKEVHRVLVIKKLTEKETNEVKTVNDSLASQEKSPKRGYAVTVNGEERYQSFFAMNHFFHEKKSHLYFCFQHSVYIESERK